MATTRKGGRKPPKTTRKAAPKAIAPTGPVTLAQAKKLAAASHPELAARPLAKSRSAVPPASPATLGAERKRLRKERKEERARRLREYKATMAIMKRHGAARPAAPGSKAKGAVPKKAASFQPLQVFAEGDSWFDYPYPFFGGSIVPRLEQRLGVPILNMAKAGDEVRFMLGVESRKLLRDQLSAGCPAGGPWDVLLFSGGGNDIVDNPMALWVRRWKAGVPAAQLINQARFDAVLSLVIAGYEDLIAMRDELSPGTHLVFHAYDFALADGRGACHLGPWLKPTFDLQGFPDEASRNAVVRLMLEQFAAALATLVTPTVTLINAQNTLAPVKASWHNELHPTGVGFNQFADIFHSRIKLAFPGRVV